MCFLNIANVPCTFAVLSSHTHSFCRVKGDSRAWKDSQVCLDFQDQKGLLVQEVQR